MVLTLQSCLGQKLRGSPNIFSKNVSTSGQALLGCLAGSSAEAEDEGSLSWRMPAVKQTLQSLVLQY